jgi:hypothetical protein
MATLVDTPCRWRAGRDGLCRNPKPVESRGATRLRRNPKQGEKTERANQRSSREAAINARAAQRRYRKARHVSAGNTTAEGTESTSADGTSLVTPPFSARSVGRASKSQRDA